MQLADVVQQRAGDEQIAVRLVHRGEMIDHFHDLEDVLEQSAAIGVMHLARGGPDAEPLGVRVDDPRKQRAQRRPVDAGDSSPVARCHISSTGRGAHGMQSSLPESAFRVLGNDAADLVENELEALIEEIAPRLHRDELAGVELRVVEIDVLKDLGPHLAGDVLEDERQEHAAAASGAPFLACAQEEAGAGRILVELSDPGQAHRESRTSLDSATGRRPRSARRP